MEQCLNCRDGFEKRSKGYNRHSVSSTLSTTTGVSIAWALNKCFNVQIEENSFICSTCRQMLNQVYRSLSWANSFEERTHPSSSLGKRSSSATSLMCPSKVPKTEKSMPTFPVLSLKRKTKKSLLKRCTYASTNIDTAIRYLKQRQYLKAARCLLNSSKSVTSAVVKAVGEIIKKEIKHLSKDKESPLLWSDCKAMLNFSWESTLQWLFTQAPILSNVLRFSQYCSKSSEGSKRQSVGLIASHILHRSNRKMKIIPTLNSLLMWMGGCKSSVMTQFSKTGFCLSPTSTRRVIDDIRSSFDQELLTAKTSIEATLPTANQRELDEESQWEEIRMDVDPNANQTQENIHPGYTMCWDNIGKKTTARHQGPDSQNKMHMWALAFSVMNRVPTTSCRLDDTVDAATIPMDAFLMSSEDISNVKERMYHEISNILVEYIPAFTGLNVPTAMEHERSDVMARKSKVVNMGIHQENPSTLSGTVAILDELHKYVPSKEGHCSPVILFGDGLSCERHNSAHNCRLTCPDQAQRLEGLEPSPQEFHRRMLCLQDAYNELFQGSGATDVGTLYNLKNIFNHRSVERDISKCFNHAVDLLSEATEAYLVLMALDIMKLPSVSSPIETSTHKEDILRETVYKIIGTIWHLPDTSLQPPDPSMTLEYPYCRCHTEDEEEPMVRCGNHHCPNGTWFHYGCVNINQDVIDGLGEEEWYCSKKCNPSNVVPTYPFCICHTDMGEEEPMVECGSKSCHGQWFHWACMGLTRKDIPRGRKKWFCSAECSPKSRNKRGKTVDNNKQDLKFLYITRLLWHGVCDRMRHTAVKYGDGPGSILMWKLDLPYFFANNHPKYVILAHRLLAGVAGWLPEKLRKDITWNRTANVVGGSGNNIPLDLLNEFMNREFMDSIKYGGRLTPVSIDRHGKMIGSFAKRIMSTYCKVSCSQELQHFSSKKHKKSALVLKMVEYLGPSQLTSNIPGRSFRCTSNRFSKSVDQVRLAQKIRDLSNRLDRRRRIRLSLNE